MVWDTANLLSPRLPCPPPQGEMIDIPGTGLVDIAMKKYRE